MRRRIRQLPIIGPLSLATYRFVHREIIARHIERRLASSVSGEGRCIAQALRSLRGSLPEAEQGVVTQIEDERQHLLSCDEPLVDGSLGEPILYDEGSTIKAACAVSKGRTAGLLMYLLVRGIKPRTAIELGTNTGISSAYLAAALKANAEEGRLLTLEASPYRLRLARELHERLDLPNVTYVQGLFADTLRDTLAEFGPFEFAFIDGNHQYQATLDYYQLIWEHSKKDGAVFLFDDIRWSDGMKQAWSEIQEDEKTALSVDVGSMGICVSVQEPRSPRRHFGPLQYAISEPS